MAQDQPADVTATAPARRGRPAIVSGAVLLLLGIVCAVIGIVGVVATAAGLVSGLGTQHTTPARFAQSFEAATTYAVYERAVAGTGTAGVPFQGRVAPGDVTVTASDGSTVIVDDAPGLTDTVTSGSSTYLVVATFTPPATGVYTVSITTDGAVVLVAPSVTAIAKALPWLSLIGLGALLGLAGVVALVVGLVMRNSGRRPAAAPGYAVPGYGQPTYVQPGYPSPAGPPVTTPALPPPGWYPDAERPGGVRYWDGSAWTEHRA